MGQQIAKPGKTRKAKRFGSGGIIERLDKSLSPNGDLHLLGKALGVSDEAGRRVEARQKASQSTSAGASMAPGAPPAMKRGGKVESRVNEAGNYTKPTMRKKIFEQIKAGDKGGKPRQWSARKAQMLAAQYKAKGGGYRD